MKNQAFWRAYENKDFSQATKEFESLTKEEKENTLSTLFQQSQNHTMPQIVSVLQRNLHPGKQFEDFHQAWLPHESYCDPTSEGGLLYPQYFSAPTRVINAINMRDPNEIISVGLTWIHTEEQTQAMNAIARGKEIPGNQERAEQIKQVADKIGDAKICIAKSDDNLGVPF